LTTRRRRPATPLLRVNKERAINTAMQLLSVPGISGEEQAAADEIVRILGKYGLPKKAVTFDNAHKKSPHGGQCGNLIIKLPGTTKGPRRMLMAHMDTVPVCVGSKPVRRKQHIVSSEKTGLGADNRSGVGAVVTALIEILDRKLPHPPLTALFTIQEEIGLVGARYVDTRKLGAPKLVFNWDGGPAECLEIGATGGYHLLIEIEGIPSHAGGSPEKGVSAAMIAALAMADLEKNGWSGLIMKGGVRGTSNIGVVCGGDATNVVMDKMHIEAECRSFSIALRNRIADAYKKAFERAAQKLKSSEGKRGKVTFTRTRKYEAFKLPRTSPCVNEAIRVLHALNLKPVLEYSNGGLDANWLAQHKLHTVTMGAGTLGAHTTGEKLVLRQYLDGCRVALGVATGL
jgi:tripeptide aminopeptidase